MTGEATEGALLLSEQCFVWLNAVPVAHLVGSGSLVSDVFRWVIGRVSLVSDVFRWVIGVVSLVSDVFRWVIDGGAIESLCER